MKIRKDNTLLTDITSNENTKIVVWGTNLSSNVGYPKFTKNVSIMVVLPPKIEEILTGLLLSDAWILFPTKSSKNACIGFAQSLAHLEYCLSVHNALSHYCSNYPTFRIRKRLDTNTYGLQFYTRSLPCFTNLYNCWYPNKEKVVPLNIFNSLTPIALAHWISGDGSVQRHGLLICTDSFSIQDITLLINVLIIRYDLICTIQTRSKGQYRIYISEKSMDKLRSIVAPYMVNSMLYKIKQN